MSKIASHLVLLLLVGALACAAGLEVVRPPDWIGRTPESRGAIYGVGSSRAHLNTEEGVRKAIEDAIEDLAKSVRVEVKSVIVDQVRTGGGGSLSWADERVEEEIQSMVEAKAYVLSTWVDPKTFECYALVGVAETDVSGYIKESFSNETALTFEDKGVKQRDERPIWVNIVPRRKGYLYAVGRAPRYLHPDDSRKEAAEDARAKLAHTVQSKVSSMIVNYLVGEGHASYSRVDVITKQISEVTLEGVEILERWEDPEDGANYALARLPLMSVRMKILENAEEISQASSSEEDKLPTSEEVEKAAERAFEELDEALSREQLEAEYVR